MIPTIAGDIGLNLAITKFQKMITKNLNILSWFFFEFIFAKCENLAQKKKKTLNRSQLKT
jgi:hypothetical protein